MNKNEFQVYIKKLNIDLDNNIILKLNEYYKLLIEWNEKFNLTSITKEEDVLLNHFYDSICLIRGFDYKSNIKLCDFGTGAGFPGMIIAIFCENISVTLVESNAKKCLFLNEVKEKLNIKNVIIINNRIEDYSKNNREIFDIVTCRAVTSLPIIIEISGVLVKENGFLLPLKSNVDDELNLSIKVSEKLGLKYIESISYSLPISNAFRTIIKYKKIHKSDIKYPENYNTILKKYKNK